MKLEDYFEISGTYEIKDGLYNVKGDVELNKKVEKLPVKFGSVTGYFNCSYNKLITLEGFPNYIGSNFYCDSNNLTSLEGCPTKVGGYFYCRDNNLTSLKGCPTFVGGDFYCDENLKNTKEYLKYKIIEKLRS